MVKKLELILCDLERGLSICPHLSKLTFVLICVPGQRCQDMISTYRCVDLLEETSSSDGDSDDVQGWVFALLAVGTIIGCMIWLVVYIQFSKGSLKETKRKMPRKKNLKKLKKGINWEHFEKSKQAERLAKINLLNSKWQIPQDEFQIRSTLDAGEFASIHAGLWNPSDGRQVALKRARDPLNLLIVSELQNEFEILTELTGNQNVIELLGITYMGDGEQPQLNIVFPLYHRGNLQTVLLELRDTESHGEPSGSRVGLVEIQVIELHKNYLLSIVFSLVLNAVCARHCDKL